MTTRCAICQATCLLFVALILILLGASAVFLHKVVDEIIASKMPLSTDSKSFKLWRKPPATPFLKVYFFNVTNGEEHLQDKSDTKLVVQEFGPYVYSEKWEKVDVVWNANGTVSYKQKKVYKFEPTMSAGSEDDEYTLPNVPMLSAVASTKQTPKSARKAVSKMLEIFKSQPFIKRTVREWLWGFDDPILKLGRMTTPDMTPFDKFGIWYGRNDTPGKIFTVRTGQEDVADFAKVEVWDGFNELPFWGGSSCNAIRGTDGSGFPGFLNESSTFDIFNQDMCRSLKMVRHSTVVYGHSEDFEVFRFHPADSTFGDTKKYPENECFCPDGPPCSKSGTFNLSTCQFGVPVFVSWPHFLHGDKSLLEDVQGLHPNQSQHQFFIDIEPKLGVPVRAKARLQINIQMVKVEHVKQSDNFAEVLVPLIWFEDGIDSLPDELMDIVREAVILPDILQTVLICAAAVIGILMAFCVVGCTLLKKCRKALKERQDNLEFDNLGHNITG